MLASLLLAPALHPASNPPPSCRRVFVSNLPFACGEAELSTALAERFGPVSSLRLAQSRDADSSGHRGFGTRGLRSPFAMLQGLLRQPDNDMI